MNIHTHKLQTCTVVTGSFGFTLTYSTDTFLGFAKKEQSPRRHFPYLGTKDLNWQLLPKTQSLDNVMLTIYTI